jgi:acetate kinase
MNILVLNSGSSSLRFQIIQTDLALMDTDADRRLASGTVSRIGAEALITCQASGHPRVNLDAALPDHHAAIDWVLDWIVSPETRIDALRSRADIHAVGHRVVHGGERFRGSELVTPEVIAAIEDCMELAPLHNPANLRGIRAALQLLGDKVPQVAVFDTSFHATMPAQSYLYAIPYQFYRRNRIRRYGFHGTSHRYVAHRYAQMSRLSMDQANIITLHLGNGCSACAVKAGRSFDTSMGFTPLEGLVMGTRSGDVDPAIIEFLVQKEGMTSSAVDTLLNKESGLLGLSGLTSDMRELLKEESENHDRRAGLAIDIFCARVKKYIGAYFAEMGGAEAVIFTGGIGENSPVIRERICGALDCLGLLLDRDRNNRIRPGEGGEITREGATLKAFVIPTNEELMIARDTVRILSGRGPASSGQESG